MDILRHNFTTWLVYSFAWRHLWTVSLFQILEIENPTRVDVPEDNLFFELIEDFEGINNVDPQQQQQQPQQQQPQEQPYGEQFYQDEGIHIKLMQIELSNRQWPF